MSFKSTLAVLFFSVLSLLPVACKPPSDTVTVVSVIDGDTIVIEGGYHVRYIGIDSPEADESYYSEAKQMNIDLLAGRKVRLESDTTDKDKYGRLLRYIFVDDIFVNAEMVRQGCAWAYAYQPDVKYQVYLEAMEKEARQLKRGFWR
jgi:micrococcal nuclease